MMMAHSVSHTTYVSDVCVAVYLSVTQASSSCLIARTHSIQECWAHTARDANEPMTLASTTEASAVRHLMQAGERARC